MTNKKAAILIFGLLSVSVIVWLLLANPYLKRMKVDSLDLQESEVSYRDNYDQLVQADEEQGIEFPLEKVKYATVVAECFPFTSNRLDSTQTQLILEILNDTSSYRWGEFGTPFYDRTIFYFDSSDKLIGYTMIDMMGEIESYPYCSLMKWGMMTDKSFSRLIRLMNRK